MPRPLEAVPNFSEGRDQGVIAAVGAALGAHARVLDLHVDADHNRCVYTLTGSGDELAAALAAGVAEARDRIDLTRHEGVHPCIGAADVVPIVPVWPDEMERARACALEVARRIGDLGLPVFLYRELSGHDHGPAFFRRGGTAELQRRLDARELAPAFGPARLHPRAGGVIVGARRPLLAFNVDLRTADLEVARAIAAVVRESGGGLPGVRALGLFLPGRGCAQVSMNVEDPVRVPLEEVVARIHQEARARGVEPGDSELIGLVPAGVVAHAARAALGLPRLDASRLLELRALDV